MIVCAPFWSQIQPLPKRKPYGYRDVLLHWYNLTWWVLGKAKVINRALQDIGMGRYQWKLFFLCGFGWMADK